MQLGYGLGTARYKSDENGPVDPELVKTVVMAIKAGYYHLDGAQGSSPSIDVCMKFSADGPKYTVTRPNLDKQSKKQEFLARSST